ncbi:MAG: spore germination protein, partial [Defluviitaleaceae bacterium]|nr:spore germination protein [Defluviitaleaceae bacterium]
NWRSVFPQAQLSERPDKVSASILEGRIAIIVDGSPFVMVVPVTFGTFFQSSEDYYERWQIMSFVRTLRYIAGIMAVALPGLYIALAVYHPSMLPTLFALKIAGARQSVPFPALVEILIMEAAFELLREAGIRLPAPIGSTIGIVGGLIIGQAAVEAGLVSPIVVIVVAITGIAGFAIPHVSMVSGFRLMKYVTLFASAALGLFGFWLAAFLILIHLVSLRSVGFPYMFPFASGEVNNYGDFKDTLFRLPAFMMKKRPIFANSKQTERRR